jgi:nitroreductase
MDIPDIILTRRTHKSFTPDAPSKPQIRVLLEAGTKAPQHRLHNPWRFTVLQREELDELAAWLPTQKNIVNYPDSDKGPKKITKLCDKYLRSIGTMILVTQVRRDDRLEDSEDLMAVSAAVQNILLTAEAMGLAHFWASSAGLRHPSTLAHCGIDTVTERFVAAIMLGRRTGDPNPPKHQPWQNVTRFGLAAGNLR